MITQAQFSASILPFTLSYEGYYADMVNDKGKETYRGISRVNNPGWTGWTLVDRAKPLKHNQEVKGVEPLVKDFYWSRFRGLSLDKLDSVKVGLTMFDYNVHGGFNGAVLRDLIKRRYGKIVTPETVLPWVNSQSEDSICSVILEHRKGYLEKIIKNDPTQKKFEDGWFKRLTALKTFINLKTIGISAGLILLLIALYFLFIRKDKNYVRI